MMRPTIALVVLLASCAVSAVASAQNQKENALVQPDWMSRPPQPHGRTVTDSRIAVLLPADDHARIVEDMRVFLGHTADLLDATADQDWGKVQVLAASAQPPLHLVRSIAKDAITAPVLLEGGSRISKTEVSDRDRTRPARMQKNLPQAYRDMLLERRLIIEEIERDAQAIKDPLHTVRQVAQVQRICVACHLTYRHEVVPVIQESASQASANPK